MTIRFDFVIAGAGMAGASLAAKLAPTGASVLLLEAESTPGYHSTGRSAANWHETYGGPGVQPLTTASGEFLRTGGYLSPLGALTMARRGEEADLAAFVAPFLAQGVVFEDLNRAALEALIPGLAEDWAIGALEASCQNIDVARLHQDYLAEARRDGAEMWTSARLARAEQETDGWLLTAEDGRQVRAGVLVDAAGAWADEVAKVAGITPLGITPYRRTIVQIRVGAEIPENLPLVLDLAATFYFKPEAGRLWLSPHDETPTPPCDAAPEELDIAFAIDRFEHAVDWPVQRVEHKWAGLRSFAPDRLPVYGFSPENPRFFWCAGQGGFGIQTAPAASDVAARLLLGKEPGVVDPAAYSPVRFVK